MATRSATRPRSERMSSARRKTWSGRDWRPPWSRR